MLNAANTTRTSSFNKENRKQSMLFKTKSATYVTGSASKSSTRFSYVRVVRVACRNILFCFVYTYCCLSFNHFSSLLVCWLSIGNISLVYFAKLSQTNNCWIPRMKDMFVFRFLILTWLWSNWTCAYHFHIPSISCFTC